MRSLLLITIAGVPLLLLSAFFQTQPPVQQKSSSSATMNDSIFTADSLRLFELYPLRYEFHNLKKFDSLAWLGAELEKTSKRLLVYRQDSTLEAFNIAAQGILGQGLVHKGFFEEGISLYKKSIRRWEDRFGEDTNLSEFFVFIGASYQRMGDLESYFFYLEKSYDIIKKLPPTHMYHGNAMNNFAYAHRLMGRNDLSIKFHREAIRAWGLAGMSPSRQAGQYIYISMIERSRNNFAEAKKQIIKALEIALPQTGALRDLWLGRIYAELGHIYADLGDTQKAKDNLFLGLKHLSAPSLESPELVNDSTEILSAILDIYTGEGNFALALKYMDRMIQRNEEYYGKERIDNVALFLQKAHIYTKMGDHGNALAQCQVALHHLNKNIPLGDYLSVPAAEQLPPTPEAIETATAKAIAFKNYLLQNPDQVEESIIFGAFDLAQQLSEKLLTQYTNRAAKARLQRENRALYEAAIETAYFLYYKTQDPQYLDRAFQYMEKYKALLLLGALKDRSDMNFQNIPPKLLAAEKELNKKATLYENLLFQARNEAEQDEELVRHYEDVLFRARQSKDSLKRVLANRYPEYYDLKYNLDVASLTEVQRRLKKDEALIEYFAGDSTLFLLAVTPRKAFLERISMDSSFQKQISAIQRAVARSPLAGLANKPADFVENSHALYRQLLEPVAQKTNARKWIIIPDGLLGYVPFQALLTEPVEGRADYRNLPYLLTEKTVWQEYSATVMLQDFGKKKGELPYAGFAPVYQGDELIAARGEDSLLINRIYEPVARNGLSALAYNQEEVAETGRVLAGQTFLGPEATERNFKERAPDSRILHLAMHALTNDEAPMYSQLVFSQDPTDTSEDGSLYAYEIYNLDLPADLAVLSACNTGNGRLQRGEGIMSLSRAFKYAGCPNIVMSLWRADDFTTKELVTGFFRRLREDRLGKAEALQQARLDFLRNTRAELTHPYYWAGLVYIGKNVPLEEDGRSYHIALLLLLLVLPVALLWRRKASEKRRAI